jgi:hypothetical protein
MFLSGEVDPYTTPNQSIHVPEASVWPQWVCLKVRDNPKTNIVEQCSKLLLVDDDRGL